MLRTSLCSRRLVLAMLSDQPSGDAASLALRMPRGAVLLLSAALAANPRAREPPQLPPPASCRHRQHLLTRTHTCCMFRAATSGSLWGL